MDKRVISDQLSHLLDNQQVIAAVFTSYNFESDFFELDVIPLLLDRQIPFSSDDRVKTFQVREALRTSCLEMEVFYDLPIFRRSAERSPEMEYFCHGVNLGNNAFHAKNIYVLVVDKTSQEKRLLVAAGSNNLTRAGWWENIEVQHWEVVEGETVSPVFIQQLKSEIDWLMTKRAHTIHAALDMIRAFIDLMLDSKKKKEGASNTYYYSAKPTRDFFSFLHDHCSEALGHDQHWTLEIISPFFAENSHNTLHEEFLSRLGVKDIIMLLPKDQENAALCTPEYYQHIKDSKHIAWGEWLGVADNLYRRVHAKIYHFYNDVQSWMFVGSVNFSHKAIYDNVESGFLTKMNTIEPLLSALPEHSVIDDFCPSTELEPGTEDSLSSTALPELHLSFNWLEKRLIGRTAQEQAFQIDILNAEGSVVVDSWVLLDEESECTQPKDALEVLLRQGSLITVRGKNMQDQTSFPAHKVMLQQIGWSHKPIDLPDLSPEQILAIYAGMTHERRELMFMNARVQQLVLKKLSGEITASDMNENTEQFFCEYAEVFYAFRMLKKKLVCALEKHEMTQVDYYLTGTGMDSLPALITRACDDGSESYSAVTAYLLLLSIKEFYQHGRFIARINVALELARTNNAIACLKKSKKLVLERKTDREREAFFQWFETQFLKEYVAYSEPEGGAE